MKWWFPRDIAKLPTLWLYWDSMSARERQQIELLPREEWEKGSFGKFLKWALSVGRYIVIATELIVIAAFLSRFKLDHDLTNLYEEIKQKQAIVEANSGFETEFRFLQSRLQLAGELQQGLKLQTEVMEDLAKLVPVDVTLNEINIQNETVDFSAIASSEQGMASFVANLQKEPSFRNLILSESSTGNKQTIGIQFDMSAEIGNNPTKQKEE